MGRAESQIRKHDIERSGSESGNIPKVAVNEPCLFTERSKALRGFFEVSLIGIKSRIRAT